MNCVMDKKNLKKPNEKSERGESRKVINKCRISYWIRFYNMFLEN